MDDNQQNLPKTESQQDLASRLQAILQTAVDGIITIDERGIVEFVNPATCKIFGYADHEILGQIDIDGHTVGAFDASDEAMLEAIAKTLAARWL